MNWFTATVSELVKETPDSVSITLTQPVDYNWLPGQHIQIKIEINGQEYKRIFSISSEVEQALRITVKKTARGPVSKHLNSTLKVGDEIQIGRPSGRFCLQAKHFNRKSYYFFAAGSGITPIYAMINHVLALEPQSYTYLLYGNKNAKNTIFKQQLEQLEQRFSNNLVIKHCHSSPSWLKSSPWHSGRIDETAITRFIQENPPYAQDCQYYVCGPDTFIPNVKAALNEIDVPDSCIHSESFGGKAVRAKTVNQEAMLTVDAFGKSQELTVGNKQSLLQAMQDNNLDVPYSCEAGVCGTCQCQLTSGEVNMLNNAVLSKKELSEGKILACQAYPKTAEVKIKYD